MSNEERVPTLHNIAYRSQNIESHLDEEKAAAFQVFKQRCIEEGLLDILPGLGKNDVGDGITDDCTLLRFLRARQYDPEEAFKQFSTARATQNADELISAYDRLSVEDFERCRQMYPGWTGRRDKSGLPVYCFEVSKLDAKSLAEYKKSQGSRKSDSVVPGASPSNLVPLLVYFENMTRFVLPLCSAVQTKMEENVPVTSCLYLVDISALSMKQAWSLREYIQDVSSILANNYPEVIDKVYIIGAPFYFSKIWAFVKGWVEPNTAAKLVFLSEKEVLPTLYDRIDLENVPKMFGGSQDFTPGMLPDLDPEIKKSLNWKTLSQELPAGPVKWTLNGEGKVESVAVGTIKDGNQRMESLAGLELS